MCGSEIADCRCLRDCDYATACSSDGTCLAVP